MASSSTSGPFRLYIPHLAPWIPEKMVYAVIRNWGLGFLTKTGEDQEGNSVRAVTLIKRQGRDGKRDFQSAVISFDYPFTRGPENAGNAAILEHLHGGEEIDGQYRANHVEVVYQEAGANPKFPDDPARYWKVFLYNETHRQQLLSQPTRPAETTERKRPRCVLGKPKASTETVSTVKAVQFSDTPVEDGAAEDEN